MQQEMYVLQETPHISSIILHQTCQKGWSTRPTLSIFNYYTLQYHSVWLPHQYTHLTSPFVCPEVRLFPILWFVLPTGLMVFSGGFRRGPRLSAPPPPFRPKLVKLKIWDANTWIVCHFGGAPPPFLERPPPCRNFWIRHWDWLLFVMYAISCYS
jgi:hypothetical protein